MDGNDSQKLMKMEVIHSSETSVTTYNSTRSQNPEHLHRHLQRREDLKSHIRGIGTALRYLCRELYLGFRSLQQLIVALIWPLSTQTDGQTVCTYLTDTDCLKRIVLLQGEHRWECETQRLIVHVMGSIVRVVLTTFLPLANAVPCNSSIAVCQWFSACVPCNIGVSRIYNYQLYSLLKPVRPHSCLLDGLPMSLYQLVNTAVVCLFTYLTHSMLRTR
jgi:hypothetical protein